MSGSTDHPDPDQPGSDSTPRLNLLLSYGGWREGSAVDQLPHLLTPLGIHSMRVYSGEEAAELISTTAIHIAVVDLAIPLHKPRERDAPPPPSGPRVLQLLRRLEEPPPTVVVRPPQPAARESARTLSDALRQGAFAVLDRPLAIETLLEVMRRVLRRHYADHWPRSA